MLVDWSRSIFQLWFIQPLLKPQRTLVPYPTLQNTGLGWSIHTSRYLSKVTLNPPAQNSSRSLFSFTFLSYCVPLTLQKPSSVPCSALRNALRIHKQTLLCKARLRASTHRALKRHPMRTSDYGLLTELHLPSSALLPACDHIWIWLCLLEVLSAFYLHIGLLASAPFTSWPV